MVQIQNKCKWVSKHEASKPWWAVQKRAVLQEQVKRAVLFKVTRKQLFLTKNLKHHILLKKRIEY